MEVKVRQEEIVVERAGRPYKFTVTHIPTATSGSWFTVHEACEVWGAVAIDDLIHQVERAIKKAFGIPVKLP